MPITEKGYADSPHLIEIDSYKFENFHNLTYSGSEVNCTENKELSAGRCLH
jgi:hypothetical protein